MKMNKTKPLILEKDGKIVGFLRDFFDNNRDYKIYQMKFVNNKYKPVEVVINNVNYLLKHLEF